MSTWPFFTSLIILHSHLLAHRGLAPRIGNLLGQLHFSDDQLIRTQKDLKDVAMPNFGNVGKELAKEINEPTVEEESDDESKSQISPLVIKLTLGPERDRMLLECEPSIIAFQTRALGFLARSRVREQKNRDRKSVV